MLFHQHEYEVRSKTHSNDLYDKIQTVHFRVSGRDDKLPLNVKVSLINKYGINDETVLKVIITDTKNPMILYTTEINSEIYAKLKQKLALLIDFSQFPNKFINFLALCANETDNTSKYILSLEEVNSDPYDIVEGKCILLKIVKVNQFQRVCLTALHVIPGSEMEVNNFMSTSMQRLKQQIEQLERKIKEGGERNLHAEENLNAKNYEIAQIKAEKDLLKKTLSRLDSELNEKNMKLDKMHKNVRTLQDEILKSEAEKNILKNTHDRLDAELKDRNAKLNKMHNNIRTFQDEILKSESKISRLESEIKEKTMFITNLEQRYYYLEKDLSKANEIITKMNKEIIHMKNKLTERTKIVVEQEKIIEKFRINVENNECTSDSKNEQIRKLEQEIENLKMSLKISEEKIKTKEEAIKKNERVIGWLNDIVSKQDIIHSQAKNSKCSASSVSSNSRPTSATSKGTKFSK